MIVGTVRETYPDERRVAITPHVVPPLAKAGCEVVIESGSGAAAGFPDAAYADKGARVAAGRDEVFQAAELVAQVRAAGANPERGAADLPRLRPGQVLVGFCEPLAAPAAARGLAERGVTLFAMELVPRISRAQSMDALSSMATVAGYKAVLLAAEHLPKFFPMMMTAAGTVAAARVFVIGAGVAGLQAIATARRLGAQVEAYDIRPSVKEQVQSLGAKFVEMDLQGGEAEDRGGYARAMGEEFYRRQAERMRAVVAASDVVIATAAVPGKRAPVLITSDMVGAMHPGAVIVDLAAEQGGNCELTRAGATVVEHGVTILAPVNLAATVPYDASQLYAKNVATFVRLLVKDGKLQLGLDDEIVRETLVSHGGEVVHPRVREALGQPAATAVGGPHQS
jgi:NAD(P) transhydrogenase subunit alpha